jgi:pyridoxine 4-dehydrogenase
VASTYACRVAWATPWLIDRSDLLAALQSDVLESVAKRLDATPTAVAQSWLLQHSTNIMLIPGTSSVTYLRENITGAALTLPVDAVAELNAI